ncbi:MAG: hypothetical protein ACOCTH_01265 [Halodesulfurarchaeum sp.]
MSWKLNPLTLPFAILALVIVWLIDRFDRYWNLASQSERLAERIESDEKSDLL